MADEQKVLDCLIVGAGAAGCAAATYLSRFCRDIALVDGGESRLDRIPRTHNTPGYPEGIEGPALHALLRRQVARYGAPLRSATVTALELSDHGFIAKIDHGSLQARTILIATGVKVKEPAIQGLEACVREGLVRYCPICDGYEVRDRRLAVLGAQSHSLGEAHFLRTFTADITFIPAGVEAEPRADACDEARAAGIKLAPFSSDWKIVRDGDTLVLSGTNSDIVVDALYPCLGVEPQSELARRLGAGVDNTGALITNAHQRTTIEHVYAAGDVTAGVDQIAAAFGQAAIAACAIHNALRDIGV